MPPFVSDVLHLLQVFPTFPRSMMMALVLRMEGNCEEVYHFLLANAWVPTRCGQGEFRNQREQHFTIPYFFGVSPTRSELKRLFRRAPVGSFITFYRYTMEEEEVTGFKYFICYKNQAGGLSERSISVPEVPPPLFLVMQLGAGLNAPESRHSSVSFIPFFDQVRTLSVE